MQRVDLVEKLHDLKRVQLVTLGHIASFDDLFFRYKVAQTNGFFCRLH